MSTWTRSCSADGSLSDTALGTQHNMGGSRRVKMAGTTGKMSSMGKKSSSTSQLSATGERIGGNATVLLKGCHGIAPSSLALSHTSCPAPGRDGSTRSCGRRAPSRERDEASPPLSFTLVLDNGAVVTFKMEQAVWPSNKSGSTALS